jgi:hypothetical protein
MTRPFIFPKILRGAARTGGGGGAPSPLSSQEITT